MSTQVDIRINALPIFLVLSFVTLSTGCTSDSTKVDADNIDVEMDSTDTGANQDEIEVNGVDGDVDNVEVDATHNEANMIDAETVVETVPARELPRYNSAPTTALEFSEWLRTSVDGENNNGGWSCYANSLTSEVGWSGLYFGSAVESVSGMVSEAHEDRQWLVGDSLAYSVTSHNTVEFGNSFIWSDARFVVREAVYPMFSADDSRGFRVTCTRTNGLPEYA